jgi:hypothetical protein
LLIGSGRHEAVVRAEGSTVIGTGTPESCQSNAAVNALSNAVAAGGIIDFDCGPEPVTINVNTNTTQQNVTINGGGKVILSGESLRQIFYVESGGSVLLNNIEIADGSASQGGGIFIEPGAAINLYNSRVTGNNSSGDGGGIYNMGNLTLNNSVLFVNTSQGNGGGLFNDGGNVTMNQSEVSYNFGDNGGGIYNFLGDLTVDRSSIRQNVADFDGGGIYVDGPVQISNSTFDRNLATTGGGLFLKDDAVILNVTLYENLGVSGAGIWKEASSNASLKNSIVANSLDYGGTNFTLNCDGPALMSQGRNLISDGTCLSNPGSNGDLFNTDPDLAAWQPAPVLGFVPNPGSPAIDYGLGCPSVDQRGFPRPLGGGCDVGSMEFGGMVLMPVVLR